MTTDVQLWETRSEIHIASGNVILMKDNRLPRNVELRLKTGAACMSHYGEDELLHVAARGLFCSFIETNFSSGHRFSVLVNVETAS